MDTVEPWLVVEPQVNKTLYRSKNFFKCFVFYGGANEIGETEFASRRFLTVRYKKIVDQSKSRNYLTEPGLFLYNLGNEVDLQITKSQTNSKVITVFEYSRHYGPFILLLCKMTSETGLLPC